MIVLKSISVVASHFNERNQAWPDVETKKQGIEEEKKPGLDLLTMIVVLHNRASRSRTEDIGTARRWHVNCFLDEEMKKRKIKPWDSWRASLFDRWNNWNWKQYCWTIIKLKKKLNWKTQILNVINYRSRSGRESLKVAACVWIIKLVFLLSYYRV